MDIIKRRKNCIVKSSLKKFLSLIIVIAFGVNSFAAIVSDNDGSAFITKAEFDSLKNDFQTQIDQYNTSLDSKIDGAIASYLSGIKLSTKETIEPKYFNKLDSYIYAKNSKELTYLAPLTFNHVAISDRNGISTSNAAQNGAFVMQMVSTPHYGIGQFDYQGKLNGIVYSYLDVEKGFVALKGTSAPTDEGTSPGKFYSNHSMTGGGNWNVTNAYLGNGCLNWLSNDIEAYGTNTWSINDNRGMGSIQSSCSLTRTCTALGLLWGVREYPNSMTVLGYPNELSDATNYLGHFESTNNTNYGSGNSDYSSNHKWVNTAAEQYKTYVESYWVRPASWNLSVRVNDNVTWLDYYVGVLEKLKYNSTTKKYAANASAAYTYDSSTSFFDSYTDEDFDSLKSSFKINSGMLPMFKAEKVGEITLKISGIKKFNNWDGVKSELKSASLPSGSSIYLSIGMATDNINLGAKTNLDKLIKCNGYTYDSNGYFKYTQENTIKFNVEKQGWISIGVKCLDSSSNEVPVMLSKKESTIECVITYE